MYCEKKSNLVSVIASTECIPCIPKFQETHRGCVLLMFYVRQVDEWITRSKEDMQVYKSIVRCVACVASIEAVKNLHTYCSIQTPLTHILVTHLQFIQPQQDPHRFCQVTKVESRSYGSCKDWTTHNSCCICGREECPRVVNSKKAPNIVTVCDRMVKGRW